MVSTCSECGDMTSQPIVAASCDGLDFVSGGELLCRSCFDKRLDKARTAGRETGEAVNEIKKILDEHRKKLSQANGRTRKPAKNQLVTA